MALCISFGVHFLQQTCLFSSCFISGIYVCFIVSGLKISFTGPSDKMSNECEFGSDMCMMMSDDLLFSLAPK